MDKLSCSTITTKASHDPWRILELGKPLLRYDSCSELSSTEAWGLHPLVMRCESQPQRGWNIKTTPFYGQQFLKRASSMDYQLSTLTVDKLTSYAAQVHLLHKIRSFHVGTAPLWLQLVFFPGKSEDKASQMSSTPYFCNQIWDAGRLLNSNFPAHSPHLLPRFDTYCKTELKESGVCGKSKEI